MPKIYINPGHDPNSNYDPGACGNGLQENQVALKVGTLVKFYLEAVGYGCKLLQSDNLYYDSKYDDRPVAVVADANEWPADLFVSIHCNAAANPAANGTETLYYPGSENSARLADLIQSQIVSSVGTTDRGLKERPNLIVLKRTDMPAVLVELAFISNVDDAQILATQQDELARSIARGVSDYYA